MAAPQDATEPMLSRVATGDAAAVRAVLAKYGNLVWSLARGFVGSDAEAEEAVHDVFVELWRKAGQYDRSMGAEVTFVSMVARRCLIDRWRRGATRRRHEQNAADQRSESAKGDAAYAVQLHDEAAQAAKALEGLGDQQREVLRLSLAHGQSHTDIARLTGLPVGTVKTHLRRGLALIREKLIGERTPQNARVKP